MKLYIKGNNSKFGIRLYLPFYFLKFFLKFASKYDESLKIYQQNSLVLFKLLKEYIKLNGHFVLVDIRGESGMVNIVV